MRRTRLVYKPIQGQYPPSAVPYIALLPDDGKVLMHLEENRELTCDVIESIPGQRLDYRYAQGKWTIKEILGHIIDDERIYTYRALRIARGDKTDLPGFEPEDYVALSNANDRSIQELTSEFRAVRASTLWLFDSLGPEEVARVGIVNGKEVSVSAAIYHVAGHELHHIKIIKERYL